MHEDEHGPPHPSHVAGDGPRSLVIALDRTLRQRDGAQPLDVPADLARRLVELLAKYGIDGESLIRYGMGEVVAGPALNAVAVDLILGKKVSDGIGAVDVVGWRAALGSPEDPDDTTSIGYWFHRSLATLRAWVLAAPLNDLLHLTPPTPESVAELPSTSESDERLQVLYTWLYLRTVGESLDRWSTPELHLEYRWQDGELELPAPESLMSSAGVDRDELCRLIAKNAVYEPQDTEELQWFTLMRRMQDQAKTFIGQRRHVEAAALFEYLLTQRPRDARSSNNLGFCLIPVDTRRATKCFEQALESGFEPKTLVHYNLLCAAADDDEMALRLHAADRHWASTLEAEPVGALIWARDDDGEWIDRDSPDIRQDLARLALDASEKLGRFDRAAVWRERVRP